MGDKEKEITEQTHSARSRLEFEAKQYSSVAEPLEIVQYLLFRSYLQEAHLYAILDQWGTGKWNVNELQKRFIDHAQRIASELQASRGVGQLARLSKNGKPFKN